MKKLLLTLLIGAASLAPSYAKDFVKVTSADQIMEGKEYVLIANYAASNTYYGMAKYTTGKYAGQKLITVTNDTYSYNENDGLQVFTLEAQGTQWAINLGGKYLSSATANPTSAPNFSYASYSTSSNMDIAIDENAGACVSYKKFPILNTTYSNNNRFKFYASSNLTGNNKAYYAYAVLYVEDAGEATPATEVVVSPASVDGKLEIEKGQSITFTADAGENLSVGGEMVANPYTITPTEEGELTAYAVFEGAVLENVSATVAWTFKAAALVGDFVFTPAEDEVLKGTEVSFTAENAVESSYAYRFDDGDWVAGNKFTVTEECMVEVKAANVDGEEKTEVRMYTIAAAPEVGDFVFSVDEEGGVVAVLPGTKISFTAPNAVEDTYAYSFDYENWISGNEFTVTEACTVYVKAANVDGVEKEDIREYTIREAEIYTRITSPAQLKEGVKYVLIAEKNNKFYGMKTYTSGNYANSNEVTVSDDKYVFDAANGLQVFTLEKVGGDWAFNLGENYLAASGTGTPNFAISTSATALTIEENSTYGFIVKSKTYPVLYNVSSPRFKFYASGNLGSTSYGTAVLYGLVDYSALEATTIAVTPAPDAENNIALWAGETVTVAADYGDYILVNDEKVANPYTFAPAAGEYTVYALNNTEDVKGISTTFTVSVKEHVLYSKVTSTAAITAEGKYVLVSEAFNSVASAYTQGDRITGTDVTLNSGTYYQTEDALVFSFEKGENGYYLVLDNGLYLQAANDRPNFVEKSGATEFTVSFNNGNVVIANGTRSLMRNSTATNNIFRFYTSGSPIALYAATEAVEIPEHLYCHGTFVRGNWIFSEPIEFEKNGDKFSFNPVMLGELNGEAHFFFSDSKTEAAAATLATAAQSDINWAELTDNAVIYAPSAGEHTAVQGGDLHTMTAHVAGTFGNSQPHSFVAQAYKPLAMEVDFSTGVPVVTLADTDQTGIDGIEAGEANGEAEFYNLQGIRVENPAAGLYIRRQGNSTAKVYIR